jgi:hypothetical protein
LSNNIFVLRVGGENERLVGNGNLDCHTTVTTIYVNRMNEGTNRYSLNVVYRSSRTLPRLCFVPSVRRGYLTDLSILSKIAFNHAYSSQFLQRSFHVQQHLIVKLS